MVLATVPWWWWIWVSFGNSVMVVDLGWCWRQCRGGGFGTVVVVDLDLFWQWCWGGGSRLVLANGVMVVDLD